MAKSKIITLRIVGSGEYRYVETQHPSLSGARLAMRAVAMEWLAYGGDSYLVATLWRDGVLIEKCIVSKRVKITKETV